MTNEIVPKTEGELVAARERIAAQLERQQEAAKNLRSTGSFITFKNAMLKVDGQPVPNNIAEVRVLAIVGERAWYDGPYDPDTPQVPACYAFNNSGKPHEEAEQPQHVTCEGCPKNKWGTAPARPGSNVPGKGKACREGARVIVAPANVPLKSAPLSMAKVPVTSLSAINDFASRCSQSHKLSGEFIAQLSVTEDKRTFFKVHLNIREHTADIDMDVLLNRQDEAFKLATQPYPHFDEPA